ncbi:hypothetical protein BOO25_18595 [Vibrio navarrensis]|uniref:hypothetical protein n=1 Tax=Vibrio navarrensis TaxID=29495 RepID=UPI00192FA360|nr:hypothetical protein [Vibrio navarrensis]MBE3670939.1 hypothetical protein [Vibrio navarrensis]
MFINQNYSLEVLSISNDLNAQAVSVERNTVIFGILATALLAGVVYFFTELQNKVDSLEQKVSSQQVELAGSQKVVEFLRGENKRLELGLEKLQGEHAALKDRVLILEQKK